MRHPPGREFDKARPWVAWDGSEPQGRRQGRRWWADLLKTAGILLPLYAPLRPIFYEAIEKCMQSDCFTSEKELGRALLEYTADYDQLLPPLWSGAGADRRTWRSSLAPYVRHLEHLDCQSQDEALSRGWEALRVVDEAGLGSSSYGANALHGTPGGPLSLFSVPAVVHTPKHARKSDRALASPAETIAFGETDGLPWIQAERADHFEPGGLRAPALNLTRHNNGGNYAYADGHCRWSPAERVQCGSGGGKDGCPWSIE